MKTIMDLHGGISLILVLVVFLLGVWVGNIGARADANKKIADSLISEPVVCTLQHYPEVEVRKFTLEKVPHPYYNYWLFVGLQPSEANFYWGDILELDVTEARLVAIEKRPPVFDTTVTILGK